MCDLFECIHHLANTFIYCKCSSIVLLYIFWFWSVYNTILWTFTIKLRVCGNLLNITVNVVTADVDPWTGIGQNQTRNIKYTTSKWGHNKQFELENVSLIKSSACACLFLRIRFSPWSLHNKIKRLYIALVEFILNRAKHLIRFFVFSTQELRAWVVERRSQTVLEHIRGIYGCVEITKNNGWTNCRWLTNGVGYLLGRQECHQCVF